MGPAAVCGDAAEDPGEECDDGNVVDGDGCNADCVGSGKVLWSVTAAGDAGEDDVGRGITRLAGGGLAVIGDLHWSTGGSDIWIGRYGEDGEEVWSTRVESPGGDAGNAIAQNTGGELVAVGVQTVAGDEVAWRADVTLDGVVEERPIDGTRVYAVGVFQNRVAIAGRASGQMFAQMFYLNGNSVWRSQMSAQSQHVTNAIVTTGLQEVFVAGRVNADLWLARATPNAFETIVEYDGPISAIDIAQAMLVRDETIYVGGYLGTEQAADAVVIAFSMDGEVQWTWTAPGPALPITEEVEAMAFDPQGMIVAVGFVIEEDRDAFVARIDPSSGEQLWFRAYPELAGSSTARGVQVAGDGTIYVAGELTGDDGTLDAWVAAFAP